jgi:molybdopterin synthase sulfur carrier subunit
VTVEVRLPNILRPAAEGRASLQAQGVTVGEVFEDIVRQYPGLRSLLFTADGQPHRHLNIFVNDDDIRYLGRLDTKVNEEDILTLMPAVAGGA